MTARPEAPTQRIVCAAIRAPSGKITLQIRHCAPPRYKQGFVDQFGTFLTREEAWKVAIEAHQIIRRVGGDEGRLYSENLY